MEDAVFLVVQPIKPDDKYFDGLNALYDQLYHDGIVYFGYADTEELAEEYCEQFMHNRNINIVPTTMRFINGLKKYKKIDVYPLTKFTSDDGEISIIMSETEQMYCQEVLGETSDEYEDILACVENLKRFTDKKVKKLVSGLEELYRVLRLDFDADEEPELEERFERMIEGMDLAREFHFVSKRMGLFDKCYSYARNIK